MSKSYISNKSEIVLYIEKILKLFQQLSTEEIEKYDIEMLEQQLLYEFENDSLDVALVYEYAKNNENLKEKLDKILKNASILTATRCQYLLSKETSDDEFIDLSFKAIKGIMIEDEQQLQLLDKIKNLAIQRNLYDNIINKIITCKNIDAIVCAALSYEPKLIDEIFEGKVNMYLYLKANTFTDSENIEFYIDRLLEMDNNELEKYIDNKAIEIDNKILKKTK